MNGDQAPSRLDLNMLDEFDLFYTIHEDAIWLAHAPCNYHTIRLGVDPTLRDAVRAAERHLKEKHPPSNQE